ncbi:MAG: cellulase family glycosylhydrolase [Candidatus Lokiarchaeota archaeon]|nr:cellulase family glycosylhydrolase [Candidatus Lokiarchaeota archaeon]
MNKRYCLKIFKSFLIILPLLITSIITSINFSIIKSEDKIEINYVPDVPTFNYIEPKNNAILLQAEDYDNCYDTTPGNHDPLAGFYRPDDDADISQNFYFNKSSIDYVMAPSYKISNIEANEWLEWNVDFKVPDWYNFIIRLTGEENAKIHIEINDNSVTDIIDIPATGNKETWWQDFKTPSVFINSGEKRVKIVFDEVISGTLAFDYIYIISATHPPAKLLSDSDFIVDFGPSPSAPEGYIKPVETYGDLRVDGNKIVGKNGLPIQFRGFASHGPQWLPWIPDYTALNLAYNFGANILRLTTYISEGVAWENIEMRPVIDHITEEIVKDCIEAGIYVVIGFHQHANTSELLNYVDDAKVFFEHYVPMFGGYSNVIFEVLNEPVGIVDGKPGVDWSTAKNYAEEIIPRIRELDPDDDKNLIFVGTPTWCQDPHTAITDPIEDENIVYTFHVYATAHDINLQNNIDNALRKGFPIIADEWSPGHWNWQENPDVNWDNANSWIDFWEARGIGWIDWSFNIKNEPLSALVPNQYLIAGFWKNDQYLTDIGKYIRDKIMSPYNSWCYSEDINLGYFSQSNGNNIGFADVLVKDENGEILPNAEVTLEWSGAFRGSTKKITNNKGLAISNTLELPENGQIVTNGYFSNGNFLKGLKSWTTSQSWSPIATFNVINKELVVDIIEAGNNDWEVQLVQSGLAIEVGFEYTVSFDARAEDIRDISVSVGEEGGNYATYGARTLTLTTEMTHYEFTFMMEQDSDLNARLQFNMGLDINDVIINNVLLKGIHPNLTSEDLICRVINIIKSGYTQDPSNMNSENTNTLAISTSEVMIGDVNENGRVDIIDSLLIQQYYEGKNVIINLTAADVNNNGIIDTIDALIIALYYSKLITEFTS